MSFSLHPQGVGQRLSWWIRRPDYSTVDAWRGAPLLVHPDPGGCFEAGEERWLVRQTVQDQITYIWVRTPAGFPPCPKPPTAPWRLQAGEGLRDYVKHLWLAPAVHLLFALAIFAAALWGGILFAIEETVHFLASLPPERATFAFVAYLEMFAFLSLWLNDRYRPRTRWARVVFVSEAWLILLLVAFSYGDFKPSFQLLHDQARNVMGSF